MKKRGFFWLLFGLFLAVLLNALVVWRLTAIATYPYGPQWALVITVPGLAGMGSIFAIIGGVMMWRARTPLEPEV